MPIDLILFVVLASLFAATGTVGAYFGVRAARNWVNKELAEWDKKRNR